MKRRKCKIIPVEEYDKTPVVFEDDKWSYALGSKGHLRRLRKKTCFSCAQSVRFIIISDYAGHKTVERFCRDHAQEFATEELPEPVPPQQLISKLELPKITVKALQRWNMQIKI